MFGVDCWFNEVFFIFYNHGCWLIKLVGLHWGLGRINIGISYMKMWKIESSMRRIAFLTVKISKLEFVLNIKFVALFLSFPMHIYISQTNPRNSNYGQHDEQGSEPIKYFENLLWPINWPCSKVRKPMFLRSNWSLIHLQL
jgi:hypothetical protein